MRFLIALIFSLTAAVAVAETPAADHGTTGEHAAVQIEADGAVDVHGKVAGGHDAHKDEGWFVAENIVLAGVILFLLLAIYMGGKSIVGMLDSRGDKVAGQLAEAQKLKEEAQAILADMKAKREAAKSEAEKIVKQAKADAEIAREKALADLEASIARRQTTAVEKIRQAEISAIDEVKQRAVALAGGAASNVLAKHMTAGHGTAYLDQAIDEVSQRLN